MALYIVLISVAILLSLYIGYRMFKKHKPDNHIIDGVFFVNGKGRIGIDLCHSQKPKLVSVHFIDEFNSHPCHPCNPHHDKLKWEIIEKCSHTQLIVSFDVGNVREISYKVIY